MVLPFAGPRMVDPAGTVQLYEVAPNEDAEYISVDPAHGAAFPLTEAGVAGLPDTTSVRAIPVPQLLLADTLNVQVLKLEGQSMVSPLRLFGPWIVPQDAVQI